MTLSIAFSLLFAPAVRASLLGVGVWAMLRLARMRDTRSEISIWTAVLVASLAMPLLSRVLTDGVGIPLPSLDVLTSTTSVPGTTVVSSVRSAAPRVATSDALATILPLLWGIYVGVVVLGLARLATGLILTLRLFRAAAPIAAPWAAGRAIFASAQISGPITFGSRILLPCDYHTWSEAKRLAVLAHEQSHIRRGDFFIQLLAALYRALFWFSPFAWWLQKTLCELAEAASDEAAVRLLDDRASYAEILIDVSRGAHGISAQVAMAKSPDIHWRIDRILTETPERSLGAMARVLAVGAILPAAGFIACAHATAPSAPTAARQPIPAQVAQNKPPAIDAATPVAAPRHLVGATDAHHAKNLKTATGHSRAAYNPRALLEDGDAIIVPTLIPTSAQGTKKKSGDGVVILNMNRLAGSGD